MLAATIVLIRFKWTERTAWGWPNNQPLLYRPLIGQPPENTSLPASPRYTHTRSEPWQFALKHLYVFPGQVGMSSYHYSTCSVEGFVQQLASNYLPHGFWFYVSGIVPEGKDPTLVDRKLIRKYGVARSRQSRARRKQAGYANLHYLRFERHWILLATHGAHEFFELETKNMRDARRVGIQFQGYSIGVKRGGFVRKNDRDDPPVRDGKYRVRVQIAAKRYREMKAYFLDIATHRSVDVLGYELSNVPFEPYAPVRQQMLNILRVVNRARKEAGYDLVPSSVLRYLRRIVKPFYPEIDGGHPAGNRSPDSTSPKPSAPGSKTDVTLGGK